MSQPLLEISKMKRAFGGNIVIPGLDFQLQPGGVTALIGPNGAGKTTIFNLITGYLRLDDGYIKYEGKQISGMTPNEIFRGGIARTFQELRLFSDMTVLDNVIVGRERNMVLGRRKRSEHRLHAIETLAAFGMADKCNVMARDLSYAEQKFLSLARVLGSDASLLLLDEPTSGLDDRSLDLAITTISNLTQTGQTVLIIEHNLDVVREVATEIAFLQNGLLVATGSPTEIFARTDLAEIYFGTVVS